MQGDSTPTAVRRHPVLGVLVVAHIVVALVVVLAVSRVGEVVAAVVGHEARVAIVVALAVVMAGADVVAIARGRMAVGVRRQTPKSVADDPDRPWWVTPLIWGGDTGVIGSTFRVSSTSWLLLVAALAGLAPWWAGAVYGATFAVPLAVWVRTGEGAPLCQVRPRRGRLATRGVQALGVVLLVAPLLLAAACGEASPPSCDDQVVRADDLPAGREERLADHGITAVVGQGDVAFVAPVTDRWSDVVDRSSAKVALWLDHDGPVPEVTVRRIDGEGRGTASSSPTAEGLPGPVPTTVTFPGRGCWAVSVSGSSGSVEIRLAVP